MMAEEQRTKRFKHKSHKELLKEVKLPSALNQKQLENEDLEENESLFHTSLVNWRELNLAPSFLNFAKQVEPLCVSMPLLLHNWKEIVNLWVDAVNVANDDGLRTLLDLLQKLLADLRTTLLPVYQTILTTLLSLLPKGIPAEAFSTLLSTLAALFKYILVPSLQTGGQLLEYTWLEACTILKKSSPEVQRAVADVWGAFLRRLKGNEIKERAIILLAENLQDLENVGAFALVYACKSVSQTLHTNTASLFKPLLIYHLTLSTSPELTHTLIRRSLTALIHHVKSAEQFSSLADLLITQLDLTVQQYPEGASTSSLAADVVTAEERYCRTLEVLSVPTSVRQGSRLGRSHLEKLFTYLPSLPLGVMGSAPMRVSLLRFTTALYTASDMALWLGPGRTFLQRSWDEVVYNYSGQSHVDADTDVEMQSDNSKNGYSSTTRWSVYTSFTLPFHASLAELSWGGWKLFALPLVLKHTLQIFNKIDEGGDLFSRTLLAFLASLTRGKKLNLPEVDAVWRERLEAWSLSRISKLVNRKDKNQEAWSEEEAAEFNDILALKPFFSSRFVQSIVELTNKILNDPQTFGNVNSAWIIGRALEVLAECDAAEWSNNVDITFWILNAIKEWAWSADVLSGLVNLFSTKAALVNFEDVYLSLQTSLASHSHPLRLAVLRLLDSPIFAKPRGSKEVIKRSLQGEEASLDIQGVRERVVCIGRVAQIVTDERSAEISARWLLGQLKVNLRPVWSPAGMALATLSQTYGDLVWRLVFEELKSLAPESSGRESTFDPCLTWAQKGLSSSGDEETREEERTWRDPSAYRLRGAVAKWTSDSQFLVGEFLKSLPKRERFDSQSYEAQLLATLGQCSSLAEKHNRELVSLFFSLISGGVQEASATEDEPCVVLAPRFLPRPKLTAYLTLFSKFSNPKALYATGTLYALYTSLLSHPDRALQTVTLSCILTYKSNALISHEEKLRLLLEEKRWRDELATFDMEALEQGERKEVVDILTRLLFGRMLEKRGRARGVDRRVAVLTTLASLDEEELGLLVELMLKPFGTRRDTAMAMEVNAAEVPNFAIVPQKQQVGFLNLLQDVLKNLGTRLLKYWPELVGVVVDLIGHAHKQVTALTTSDEESDEKIEDIELEDAGALAGDDENEAGNVDGPALSAHHVRVYRSIRQLGLKRFADFFRAPVYFDFSPFLQSSFPSFISPRLTSLDKENTQAPSALLELFSAWTHDSAYVRYLVEYDARTLPKVYDCLIATNVKPAVISRVFDIVDRILEYSTTVEETRERVLKPHVSLLLTNLSILVERTNVASVSTPLGQRQVSILSSIAQYLTDEKQASTLLGLLLPLLRKPTKIISERVKVDLVNIVGEIIPHITDLRQSTSAIYEKVYTSLSMLFQSLRSRPGRIGVASSFRRLAELNSVLEPLASLIESLNAYSTKRVEVPDFDRRLAAFADLNENIYKTLNTMDWLPVLYNSLYFIQDHEELAIRNNASSVMRRFIDFVASPPSPDSDYQLVFIRVLFPGLKNGLRSKNELVRAEILSVIAYAVTKCEHIAVLKGMQVLLAGGDEEASFFNNILHLQIHRRSRALRRLGDFSCEGHLRSTVLADIFVPLVENFITPSTDHHLVNDAIHATGRMASQLSWGPYYALVQKYVKLSKAKDESERIYIRTVVAILDNFHFLMEEEVPEADTKAEVPEEGNEEGEVQDSAESLKITPESGRVTRRIADAVNLRLLPTLLDHLAKHDPNTDDNARLPISIGIVNVAKHLPTSSRELQITRLLTILSQILRSHSQETRDLARESLQRIAVILGPTYLAQIIRELRSALTRGPQLHVLAFVAHALLVHVTSGEHAQSFESIDDCIDDIAFVSAEVIFGESGKDVQAEEFKTKMREVRASSSKGFDSFGIASKFATPAKTSSLLAPLRAIMHETESAKVMNLVDEVLKRIATGLNSNKHLDPKELVVLCHTLITQNSKFLQQAPTRRKTKEKNDVIVQTKRDVTVNKDHYANNSYRFVAFGLDLLHTALRRTRFDFRNADAMSRLNSMIVAVGNTLYSTSVPVLVLGLRCAAGLAKCPLPSLEKSLPVFVSQALDIIKQTGNTEAEVVQVAFKALATILRDGPPVQVKEKDLIYLLELLTPDIEEPTRQAAVFAMLRAIVARRFVVPEIYNVMEKVSEVMITSQSPQVQELCRGVLLQFLLDYPQGKKRLRTQMTFLAKNLTYVYESGRKSVMEFLNAVISKFQVELVSDYSDLLFVGLVMVIANDDSAKCREMAAHLIKSLFTRLDDDRRRVLFSHVHVWASQKDRLQLARVSSQIYGFIVEVLEADIRPHATLILEDLKAALQDVARQWEQQDDENVMQIDLEWQVPYQALSVQFKVAQAIPDFDISGDQIPWSVVTSYLVFPHAWVRMASSRLLNLLFNAVPVAAPRQDLPDEHPLSAAGMRTVAELSCLQLKSEHLDEALGLQIVKNLFFVGKYFYCLPIRNNGHAEESGEGAEEPADHQGDQEAGKRNDPLPWLFTKLSYQMRSAYINRINKTEVHANWHHQPLAILRWFAAMTSHVDQSTLEKFLFQILSPLYRFTTDDTIHDTTMGEIKTLAIELQDLVQNKVGVVKFSHAYNRIRQSVLNTRRERKETRVIQAAVDPEAAAKRKLQRNLLKKASKKRKDRAFADSKRARKKIREE